MTKELKRGLLDHEVATAYEMGWADLKNGDLLRTAQAASFEVMISADTNIFYQQNNAKRIISLLILDTNRWRFIRPRMAVIHDAFSRATRGSYESMNLLPVSARKR